MLNLIIGVAIGAAFSQFWIKLFNILKEKVLDLMNKLKKDS